MTIQHLTPTLTVNNDDKDIIDTMKMVGVWYQMKKFSVVGGGDKTMLYENYIFQWHSKKGESGYTAYHSTNRFELLEIFEQIKQITGGSMRLSPVGTVH